MMEFRFSRWTAAFAAAAIIMGMISVTVTLLFVHTHTTHTIVLLLFWNLSGTTRVSRCQKAFERPKLKKLFRVVFVYPFVANSFTDLLLQPFYGPLDFVWDYPDEPVPER